MPPEGAGVGGGGGGGANSIMGRSIGITPIHL